MISEDKVICLLRAVLRRDMTGWSSEPCCYSGDIRFSITVLPGVTLSWNLRPGWPLKTPSIGIRVERGFSMHSRCNVGVDSSRGRIDFKGDGFRVSVKTKGIDIPAIARDVLSAPSSPLMTVDGAMVPICYGGFMDEGSEPPAPVIWDRDGMDRAIRMLYLGDSSLESEFEDDVVIGEGMTLSLFRYGEKRGRAWYEDDELELCVYGDVSPEDDGILVWQCDGAEITIPVYQDDIRRLMDAGYEEMVWTPDYLREHPCRVYARKPVR